MIEIITITALIVFVYYQTIWYSIIVDDVQWYSYIKGGVGSFTNLKELPKAFVQKLYGGATFGLNTKVDHAFSMFLHTLACVLIYLALGENHVSFSAALLYAVNPINNQTAIWLNGRRYQVAIILTLTMLYLAQFTPLAIVFYLFSLPFQVTAFFAPILLTNQSPLFLLAIPFVLIFGFKKIKEKVDYRLKSISDQDRREFGTERLIIIVKYFGHYFFKMFLPGRCMIIYKTLHFWGRTDKGNEDAYSFNLDFFKGALALIISAAGCFYFKENLLYAWIFMVLATIQWCAIIPVIHDLADRYVSLPNVFAMFFVSFLSFNFLGTWAVPFLAGLICYYFVNLKIVSRLYEGYQQMWSYQRYFNPATPSPLKYEIKWLLQRKDLTRAWTLIREALDHLPNDFQLLYDAAICHYRIGEFGLARNFAKKAMENYYINEKERKEPELQAFLKHLDLYESKQRQGARLVPVEQEDQIPMNRQQRRAEERKQGKLATI